jgi:hypothetical protein
VFGSDVATPDGLRSGRSRDSARRIVASLLVVIAAATASSCADDAEQQRLTEERIREERAEAADDARRDERLRQLERDLRREQRTHPPEPSSPRSEPELAGGDEASGSTAPPESAESWPEGTSAWTVILASVATRPEAEAIASQASTAGLAQAGTLLSDNHSSLHRGYWVAYSGVLTQSEVGKRQADARAAGFSDAYARYVSAR